MSFNVLYAHCPQVYTQIHCLHAIVRWIRILRQTALVVLHPVLDAVFGAQQIAQQNEP